MKTETYKQARLLKSSATWLIFWYNIHPATGTLQRIKKTFNLNRIHDKAQRLKTANEIIGAINLALKNGWNHFTDQDTAPEPELPAIETPGTLLYVMEQVRKLRIIGRKPRTVSSYESYIRLFCEYMSDRHGPYFKAEDLSPELFNDYMHHKATTKGNGSRNLNDTADFFKTCFNKAVDKLKLMSHNPATGWDPVPEHDSTLFAAYTPEELIEIKAAIAPFPHYRLLLMFIGLEWMRPHHIVRLQCRQIDFKRKTISLTPDTTKNNKVTEKQLLQPIIDLLLQLGIDKEPKDHYIFSTRDFKPGSSLYESLSTRSSEFWKSLIIDGLGIHKKQYAAKHTGSSFYLSENENVDVDFLQRQMEHSSLAETNVYVSKRRIKTIDETKVRLLPL